MLMLGKGWFPADIGGPDRYYAARQPLVVHFQEAWAQEDCRPATASG